MTATTAPAPTADEITDAHRSIPGRTLDWQRPAKATPLRVFSIRLGDNELGTLREIAAELEVPTGHLARRLMVDRLLDLVEERCLRPQGGEHRGA